MPGGFADHVLVPHSRYLFDKGTIDDALASTYACSGLTAYSALKDAGFHWATRSGVTVSIDDVVTPGNKAAILEGYETQATKVQQQFERGLVTDEERRQELIEIWTQASNDVAKAMEALGSDAKKKR